jgi:hypothetical protein
MELCQVLDDQRVKNKQQAPAQVQVDIRVGEKEIEITTNKLI